MVRKTQFSAEDVVQAGFMVVRQQGIEQLTARNVARELGASTAPVYSNFQNMEELEREVFARAAEKLKLYASEPHTDNAFLNIGIGVLRYAWDCPRWYHAFTVRTDLSHGHFQGLTSHFLNQMTQDAELSTLHPQELGLLLHKMAIFTHGMAWDICLGHVPEEALEVGIRLMEEVGTVLSQDAISRPPRTEEEYTSLVPFCQPKTQKPESLGD